LGLDVPTPGVATGTTYVPPRSRPKRPKLPAPPGRFGPPQRGIL